MRCVYLLILCLCCVSTALAADSTEAVKTRLDRPGAALYATVGGSERKIADSAQKVWVLTNGRDIVYSGTDGAGGYENEGQSLYLYNTQAASARKLMSEYYVVQSVREAPVSNGKAVLLVEMTDRNIDATHVAVIDPGRGEVFCEDGAKLAAVEGDTIRLAFYGDDDWDAMMDNPNSNIKPQKTEQQDLKQLLERPVMNNQRN